MIRLRTVVAACAAALVCARFGAPQVAPSSFACAEAARLHTHFAQVLGELARRDVSTLDAAKRATRSRLLALLRTYDRAGRFPRNEGHSGSPTPIFEDRHGTPCPTAYLSEPAGGPSLD